MAKAKVPETGEGYLGETMVHRVTRAVGVVESVTVAQAGWPPEITLKLPDGGVRKGKLSEFREPSAKERKKVAGVAEPENSTSDIQGPTPKVTGKQG